MKSKAQIKGHPLHPILVCFPIAFYTGTVVFDVLAIVNDPAFLHTAFYLNLCAVITAVAAAVPGVIDYLYTVPPASSAKKRATKHALSNSLVLILFIVAFVMRLTTEVPNSTLILALEIVGLIFLFIAGWLGGTLVYRNQIGVDVRYANAGKWKEEYFEYSDGEIEVGIAKELEINQMKLLHISGRRVVIAKTEKGYAAFNDYCTHKGGSLAGGSMMCDTVQCPWHGSQFNVHSGTVVSGPAKTPVAVYPIRESNGKLFLSLPSV